MRKLAVLMGVVLVMALALPAAAGIDTNITGKLRTEVYYDTHADTPGAQRGGLWAFGKVETKVTMSTGTDGAIKAVIGLGATESNKEGNFGDNDSPLKVSNAINLAVNTAYIEANGAWLEGTPDVTTKIGRFGTNYSDWVADLGDRDAIELSNINLGPISVAGLYGWVNEGPVSSDYLWRRPEFEVFPEDGDVRKGEVDNFINLHKNRDWRIMAVRGSGNLDVVDLSAVYVRTFADDVNNESFADYAVTASVVPAEGLKLDATFAGTNYEGVFDESGSGYRVGAELSTIPNVTLSASLWSSDDEFNPIYAKLDDKKPVAFPGWDKANERKGLEVKADTNQGGFDLGVTVKNTSAADDSNKASSYEFRASRDFNGIKGSYKYEDGDNKDSLHTFTAETTVDTPIASGVNLKGTVRLPENDDLQFAADATWTAPNGINLGLHYANYDRGDDWGGRHIAEGTNEPDGFVVRASYEISW